MSHLHKKNTILEVSIESDNLYKTDGYINSAHESESSSFIFHNVHNPEWAANALRNIRHVKKIVNIGGGMLDESTMLHIVKVMYDSDALDSNNPEKIALFKDMVKSAIERSGISFRSHL